MQTCRMLTSAAERKPAIPPRLMPKDTVFSVASGGVAGLRSAIRFPRINSPNSVQQSRIS